MSLEAVRQQAQTLVPEALERLGDYVRIKALSRDPKLAGEVRRMAEVAAEDLRAAGLDDVALLELDGALPCVKGSKIVDPEAPTVLIYGHFDQQPADPAVWSTPPTRWSVTAIASTDEGSRTTSRAG